jgi:hypothetical protein
MIKTSLIKFYRVKNFASAFIRIGELDVDKNTINKNADGINSFSESGRRIKNDGSQA